MKRLIELWLCTIFGHMKGRRCMRCGYGWDIVVHPITPEQRSQRTGPTVDLIVYKGWGR